MPGVDAAYVLLPSGVKENLILRGSDAPTSYRFILRPLGVTDVRAVALGDGGLSFFAKDDVEPVFSIDAPIVSDSASAPPADSGLNAPARGRATLGAQRLETGEF